MGEDSGGRAGALIRASRRKAGLTQRQLAAAAGISVGVVRDLEQGRTARPHGESARRLASALHLSPRQTRELTLAAQGNDHLAGARAIRSRPDPLRIGVLGTLTVWRDGMPVPLGPPMQRATLGLLALYMDTGLSRSGIIDALWGENPPMTAASMLHSYASRLRRLLGAGILVSAGGTGYRLEAANCDLDAHTFRALARQAQAAQAAGNVIMACEAYADALALWRGNPLSDCDVLRDHPAVIQLIQQKADAVTAYATAALAACCPDRALPQLRELSDRDPLNEHAHALLMIALAANGQQAAALRIFDQVRRRLDKELGIGPGAELTVAQARILNHQLPGGPDLAPPASEAADAVRAQLLPRQLPADQWRFAGRVDERKRLDAVLSHDDSGGRGPRVVVISGAPGVGKTALAVHWAHHVASEFPDGQLFVNLRGFAPSALPVPTEVALRTLLDALLVPQSRIPVSPDAQAALYRSLLAGRRFLIVLDNAADAAQVRGLLPGTATCVAIVTSRVELTSLVATDDAQLMTLDVLSQDDALEMANSRLGRERADREPRAVEDMVRLCARLPLALGIAIARAAARPDFPLAVMVSELTDERSRLDALEADEATSVRTVFSWSYQSLSDQAARTFRLLSEQPGPDISVPAAASLTGASRRHAALALAELARAHLVSEHLPGRYAFHDLLRAFAAEQARSANNGGQRQAAWQRLLDHYLHTCLGAAGVLDPSRDPLSIGRVSPGVQPERATSYEQSWAWLQAEYPVLLALVAKAATRPARGGWQIPWLLQTFLFRRGHWQDYVLLQRSALDIATQLADAEGQTYCHHGLGRACGLTGSYQEARRYLSLALELYRELGQVTAEARCRIDLGNLASRQARYEEALREAQLAEGLYRLADHQTGQAGALNNMGWYQMQLGDHSLALDSCQRSLATFEDVGNQHGAATSLASLGAIYHRLGDSARGIEYSAASLRYFQEHGDLPSQAELLSQLGEMHEAHTDSRSAHDCWQRAATIYTQLDHPDATVLHRRLRDSRLSS